MIKKCLNCKSNFSSKKRLQLFCSHSCSKKGKFNPSWKGDKVTNIGIHVYIRARLKKPTRCQFCNEEKKLDLANKSQKYLRDLSDWLWLCRRCHFYQDKRDQKTKPTQFKEGNPGPWLGKHRSEETKRKLSETLKRLGIRPIAPWRGGRSKSLKPI